ncbi:thioredoxin family protein [Methylophaga thiooxydans]|uniref:thioredoxin family protein n=1 Tax=Methylophaga thiooxydans TaxID=392484 RepID=UPI002353BAA8|nr:thioredoxin family protein [Methylophaga thiooxydans]
MFDYAEEAFTLEQIRKLSGDALVEFGAPWCENCQAASPAIKKAVTEHSGLHHIKIYDGKGKRLGRAFKVKLWPTLILLHDGNEVGRLVRPLRSDEVRQLLSKIS